MTERRVRVDMHMHTEHSPDSRMKLRAFAAAAEVAGIDVACVTDHGTIEGALQLRELGPRFEVVVGEEIATRDGELIGLFLERTIPPRLSGDETIAMIREQGGLVYVPHPFSRNRRRHIRRESLARLAPLVDAIEVFNAREAFAGDNRHALAFAVQHGLPGGAGSDAHRSTEIGRAYVEVAPFGSAAELVHALRAGEITGGLSGMQVHLGTRYDVLRKWLRRARRD